MRNRFFVIYLIISLLFIQGCSVSNIANSQRKYENKELGFSIEFPSTWKEKYFVELNTGDKSSSSVVITTSWGGTLCYIFRNTQEEWKEIQQMESPVDYSLLGENDKYAYILIPASDVQYDINDQEQVKIYNDMRNELDKIKFEIIED